MKIPEAASAASSGPYPVRGVLILCLLISLAGISNHDLWTPDEPREAALALSMQRSGDYLVPRLAGEPFVEKPPLFYVVASAAIALLGPQVGHTTAVRLTSACWGLGTLLMTFLIARRLWGWRAGRLALLVLALMPGFVHITHWILVDNALMFFVTATFWCLVEAYLGRRHFLLPLAGICAAGAFLSKGWIGLIVIGLGALGLLRSALRGWSWSCAPRRLAWHGLALLLLAGLAGAWMLALYRYAGPQLWQEWFWVNHAGRFTGQATQLGHQSGPGYYVGVVPLYILPWLVAWLYGLGDVWRRLRRRETLDPGWGLLIGWGLGGLLLLTLSSTKREIYLSVLLPALALMVGAGLREPLAKSVRMALKIWLGLMLLLLLAMVLAPLGSIRSGLPVGRGLLYALLALIFLGLAWMAMRRRSMPWPQQIGLVTALAYIAALSIACPLVDRVKSYRPSFTAMAQRILSDPQAKVGAWAFDETTRAGFYYYCDLIFPAVSDTTQLQSILKGTHPRLNGVLTLSRHFPPAEISLPAWQVIEEERMGPRRRLQWISAVPRPAAAAITADGSI